LCLRALKNIKLKNKNIADLGCGSGILGICCKILGASKVLMLEHDKQAVENAKDNIDLNGLGNSNIFVKEFDVMKNHVDNINDYHIIICNIWPHVNEKVAELNYKKIKKNAQILFTGVFRTDHENFSSFLKKQGYNIINIDILDDWYLYITEKN
jgi:ribosomal protein L11 methyltransferase